ncbi:MAG TPA: hypothetical protein VKA60_15605 [Blastocatellia bacterium]|nr:hypothetical protein [Blastocatellia bacterium]
MKSTWRFTLKAMTWAMLLLVVYAMAAHAQDSSKNNQPAGKKTGVVQPAAIAPAVTGSGTTGQITKWVGMPGTSVIGDSGITEDKLGNVGIGITAPTAKLSVAGMIQTTLGGLKFPDGTVQTTAATNGMAAVVHDTTLTGSGTQASPLTVAFPFYSQYNGLGTGFHLYSPTAIAIDGVSEDFQGVHGASINGSGVEGFSFYAGGVVGISNQGIAIHAYGSLAAPAGKFEGNVQVIGNLSASGQKNFKIDHPLDPENKYLVHASIESSEVLNVYSGNATLDADGEATVQLPDWFETLNKDFRYALTAIGKPGPGLYVAEEVTHHQFKIAGGTPGARVSWQVTGQRNDAYMQKHPLQVEVEKSEAERGFYLHPELYNQPEERGVEWAQRPEQMRRIKEMRQPKAAR